MRASRAPEGTAPRSTWASSFVRASVKADTKAESSLAFCDASKASSTFSSETSFASMPSNFAARSLDLSFMPVSLDCQVEQFYSNIASTRPLSIALFAEKYVLASMTSSQD